MITLVHKPDGSLVSDDPYTQVGSKFVYVAEGYAGKGYRAIITEECVQRNLKIVNGEVRDEEHRYVTFVSMGTGGEARLVGSRCSYHALFHLRQVHPGDSEYFKVRGVASTE